MVEPGAVPDGASVCDDGPDAYPIEQSLPAEVEAPGAVSPGQYR